MQKLEIGDRILVPVEATVLLVSPMFIKVEVDLGYGPQVMTYQRDTDVTILEKETTS